MKKRTSRSTVIIDEDDIHVLRILTKDGKMNITDLSGKLGISYNGLKTHIERLHKLGLILTISGEGAEYREKLIVPEPKAKELLKLLSPMGNFKIKLGKDIISGSV